MSDSSFIYQRVTDAILARLDAGVIPWRKTWACKGSAGTPRNFITAKPYRGVNVWLLASQYETPFWLTFNQVRTIKGAKVRKGEKSTLVVFWQILKRKDKETGEDKKVFFLRYYNVFNVEQCDGIPAEKIEALKRKVGIIADVKAPTFNPIEQCEALCAGIVPAPDVRHGGDRAYYSPALDYIQLPKAEDFKTAEAYYATRFHEVIHWTGHGTRLKRKGVAFDNQGFGSEPYSREELVAEFGATFLCGVAGIDREEIIGNAAAYIANWRKRLSEDPKLLIGAAAAAQAAADYVLRDAEGDEDAEADDETATTPEAVPVAS